MKFRNSFSPRVVYSLAFLMIVGTGILATLQILKSKERTSQHTMAAPGDELPCALPDGLTGVCTGFNNFTNNTAFMDVPNLVNEWDIRISTIDDTVIGGPIWMHPCGKSDPMAYITDPDKFLNLCNHHLMDSTMDRGNNGSITYRGRSPLNFQDGEGVIQFTVDLNNTTRQTINAVLSETPLRYPSKPSWADDGDQHDPVKNGFDIAFEQNVVHIIQYTNYQDTNHQTQNVECAGVDDRRCKVVIKFTKNKINVNISGQQLPEVTFNPPLPFDVGHLALVRQQYNPTKDCDRNNAIHITDCPSYEDWSVPPPNGERGWMIPNPSPQIPVNGNTLYANIPYTGYDTAHWDNLGYDGPVTPVIVAGTRQKELFFVNSINNPSSPNGGITTVNINHPTGGTGNIVFSIYGGNADGNSEFRFNNGAWTKIPYTGYAWRTKYFSNMNILPGNNTIQFRSILPQSICCPPQGGWGFTISRVDLEVPTASGISTTPAPTTVATNTPTPTKTPTPTPTRTPTPTTIVSVTPTGTTCTKTGDLNCDNQVGILDLSILLSNWGTTSNTADINKDGTVTILDLSILLSNWGL